MAPRWALALLRRVAPPDRAEDVLGDLEEAHRRRVRRHGRVTGRFLTGLETLEMAAALMRERLRRRRAGARPSAPRAKPLRRGRTSGVSWLDFKIALRMLVKYPGLTLVGGLGMAVAIAIGASFFVMVAAVYSTLPLEEGERVVAIESWDMEVNNQERRILDDFVTWREELESVEELGAYRTIGRNLITPDGQAEPVAVAEITASGLQVARVAPFLGRPLVAEDEREGALPVVVIGYDIWRTRFASDPDIVGRDLRLGDTVHTVIGVMPEGFAFPFSHRFWAPLRADPADYERRQGPRIFVFGRLVPGATLDGAQAELTTIGLRMAAAYPETHERLRPRVVPYTTQLFDDMEGWEFPLGQLLVTLLLAVVCANVAILVYARTATRQGEIAVRSALGASRFRIAGQLFVEALVLSAASASVGLGAVRLALRQVDALTKPLASLPFWMDFGLSFGTVANVLALTVLGAVIVGFLPAVQATGRRVGTGLQRLAVDASGIELGKTWTALIVVQVAFAVAVLPMAVFYGGTFIQYGTAEPGFAAEEFLTAWLVMDRETPPSAEAEAYRREFASRYADLQAELVRRLATEPGVSDVTFALGVPGEERTVWVEVDGAAMPTRSRSDHAVRSGSAGHEVRSSRVDIELFDAFGIPILTGRRFASGDLDATASTVIVNRTFMLRYLGDGDVLGRRVRYVGLGGDVRPEAVELERSYEIVGVVPDFPNAMDPGQNEAKLYHPLAPGQLYPVSLCLRVRGGDPATFAGRLREITAALDPTLRLNRILPLDEVLRELQMGMRMGALAISLMTLAVLLLSAAGIYALMSVAVTKRRREIGIRTALGGHPHRILISIFSRALRQIAIGVGAGVLVAVLLASSVWEEGMSGYLPGLLVGVSAFMMAAGLLAAVGPARRGLRVQPTEALRET